MNFNQYGIGFELLIFCHSIFYCCKINYPCV